MDPNSKFKSRFHLMESPSFSFPTVNLIRRSLVEDTTRPFAGWKLSPRWKGGKEQDRKYKPSRPETASSSSSSSPLIPSTSQFRRGWLNILSHLNRTTPYVVWCRHFIKNTLCPNLEDLDAPGNVFTPPCFTMKRWDGNGENVNVWMEWKRDDRRLKAKWSGRKAYKNLFWIEEFGLCWSIEKI